MGKWGLDLPAGRLVSTSVLMARLLPHCSRRKPGISEQSITAAREQHAATTTTTHITTS